MRPPAAARLAATLPAALFAALLAAPPAAAQNVSLQGMMGGKALLVINGRLVRPLAVLVDPLGPELTLSGNDPQVPSSNRDGQCVGSHGGSSLCCARHLLGDRSLDVSVSCMVPGTLLVTCDNTTHQRDSMTVHRETTPTRCVLRLERVSHERRWKAREFSLRSCEV